MTRKIATFISVAYIFTWSIVILLHLLNINGAISSELRDTLFSIGALGPFIASVLSARVFYGSEGLRSLFGHCSLRMVNKAALSIALSPVAFFGLGLILYPLFAGHGFSFETTRIDFHLNGAFSYVAWVLPFISYGLFEEVGWRGFLLPHLQSRLSAFQSTLVLTAFWATWHAPMFLFRFQLSVAMVIGFLVGLLCGAILFTAVFNLSRGSIAAAMILHLANNIASAFDRQYIVATVSTGLTILVVYVLWKYRLRTLSDSESVGNYFVPQGH